METEYGKLYKKSDYLSHINFSFFFTLRKITMPVVSHILVIYLTLNSENIIIAHWLSNIWCFKILQWFCFDETFLFSIEL